MSLRVKICGLRTPDAVDAAIEAGADMIGLVFHPKSPRFVGPHDAALLVERMRGRAESVALIVDPSPEQAAELARTVKPDWLQLHGHEAPGMVEAIRAATGCRILKAVGVAGVADVPRIAPYGLVADGVLIDAKAPADAAYPGGHGRPFDWNILAALAPTLPFMLSGGLNPDNVADAIRSVRGLGVTLSGVDVSSGVESAPGIKDIARIRAFVAAARAVG